MTFPLRQLPRDEFPELLEEIPGKPKTLYIRGTLPPRDSLLLCMVGSRATTPYGRRMCQSLVAGLARYPVAIVSGMALGIDSEAHKAALDVGLSTIAVLPSSADDASLYPSSNKALAQRILVQGGALISEYKTPFKAAQYSFAQRNRVMAGMSKATLIIEAGEKSGTLITSRLALDFNREVLCVPHELGRETGEGANRLIREGATLVRDSNDILEALGIKPEGPTQALLPTDLTETEAKILKALSEALVRDEVIEAAELSAQDANIALSSLLIRGLITERLGKIERV
ncbi:MAG TPA: DNA-processing protein DprA [Candidatus Paceibacterota bacterium]|nr:DNA-processing protein DprA [Candidatus Paceibacterota bacterium]